MLLSRETTWASEFKGLIREVGFRLKRLDLPADALAQVSEFAPHLLVIGDYDDPMFTVADICYALRIPRQLRPVALIVTNQVPVPVGEDLGAMGIDEILDAEAPLSRYATSLIQHFRLVVAQQTVLDRERDILDSLPDALMVLDDGLILWKVNRAFASLMGVDSADSLRRHLGEPLATALPVVLGPAAARRIAEPLTSALSAAVRSGESSFICRVMIGDSERSLAGQITRLMQSEKQMLVALRDVTDHERAVLREARRERLATIGNLAVGVAHEIQNPNTFSRINAANLKALVDSLQPILDDLDRRRPGLKVGALSVPDAVSRIGQAISGVEVASQRIAAVLDTLKAFGQTGGDSVRSVSVHAAVSEAALFTRHVLRDDAKLIVDLPESLPPVKAASSELAQVFINLIENAAQAFTFPGPQLRGKEPGEIRVTVDHVGECELLIAVTDNGPGMDESVQKQVFRPYFTTRPQGEGTGLGLSLSSDIMRRFEGDLTVRSRRGQGAAFLVTLKRADVTAASAIEPR